MYGKFFVRILGIFMLFVSSLGVFADEGGSVTSPYPLTDFVTETVEEDRDVTGVPGTTMDPDGPPPDRCYLATVDPTMHKEVLKYLKNENAKLLQYQLSFANQTVNPLTSNMTWAYNTNKWARVTTAHGQTLLSLAFNYGVLSMATLTFGTVTLDVELEDHPLGCLATLSEQEKIDRLLYLLMRDFDHQGRVTLLDDNRVCHEVVLNNSGYALFRDRCCFKNTITGKIECTSNIGNFWLDLLYGVLATVRYGLLFFGPLLFISSIEMMSKDNVPYVVKLKATLEKTVYLCQKGKQMWEPKYRKKLDLSGMKGLPKLKESSKTVSLGIPFKAKFEQYDINVDYRRMLTENIVQVGVLETLFAAIFSCEIRNVGPFQQCCKGNMLAGIPGTEKKLTWIKFFRKVAKCLLILLVIPFPYYIRLIIFYGSIENEEVMKRKAAIARCGLKEMYENNMIMYFTPTHALFIIIYILYATAAFMLAYMSHGEKEGRLRKILVGSFRDLKHQSFTDTLAMAVANITWPFKRFGMLGCCVGLIYWPIVVPFTVVVCLMYTVPTIYLSIRMAFYSKVAIFERVRRRRCKPRKYQVTEPSGQDMKIFETEIIIDKNCGDAVSLPSFDDGSLQLDDIDQIKPVEHFKDIKDTISLASTIIKQQATNWRRLIEYILSAVLCILTLFAVVLILSEVVGCLVEIVVFTIMGLIVNATALLKYAMLLLMIFFYCCDCFNNMEKKYLKLNKALFCEVKSRIKDLMDVTSLPSVLQENRGFKSQELNEQAEYESPDDIVEKPPNHWMINDLVLFTDSEDMPRIPKALFDEVCQIRVAGVPGPVFRGHIEAFEALIKIIIFVCFVFAVILSFAEVYKVSSTSQTLATMLGGALPMILRNFMSPPTPDVELGTVSFKSKMDEVIRNFCQYWPIYDLPFKVVEEEKKPETEEKGADGEDGANGDAVGGEEKAKPQENNNTLPKESAKNETPKTPLSPQPFDYTDNGLARHMALETTALMMEGLFPIGALAHRDHSDPYAPEGQIKVEKNVRLCSQVADDEVDLLIYMPDKYDDTWLDEWSDILSRTSRASKSSRTSLNNTSQNNTKTAIL